MSRTTPHFLNIGKDTIREVLKFVGDPRATTPVCKLFLELDEEGTESGTSLSTLTFNMFSNHILSVLMDNNNSCSAELEARPMVSATTLQRQVFGFLLDEHNALFPKNRSRGSSGLYKEIVQRKDLS